METGSRRMSLAWILTAAVLVGLIWWAVRAGWPGIGSGNGGLPPSAWDEIRIEHGADVSLFYACGQCPHPDSLSAGEVEGLTYIQFTDRFPHLDVHTFTPGRVEARASGLLCPDMEQHLTVVVDPLRNKVTVRYGRPGHLGPLHPLNDAVDPIDPGSLSAADRASLERGVVVSGEEELWSLLEGLGH